MVSEGGKGGTGRGQGNTTRRDKPRQRQDKTRHHDNLGQDPQSKRRQLRAFVVHFLGRDGGGEVKDTATLRKTMQDKTRQKTKT